MKQQGRELKEPVRPAAQKSTDNSSASGRYTDSRGIASSSTSLGSEQAGRYDIAEMMRIKQELEAAKSVISRQEQELAESRTLKHTMDQAMGPASEADYGQQDISDQTIGHLQSAFNASARPFTSKNPAWRTQDDARSDSDFSVNNFNSRGWNSAMPGLNNISDYPGIQGMMSNQRAQQAYAAIYGGQPQLDSGALGGQRSFSGSSSSFGYDPRLVNDMALYGVNGLGRRNSQLRTNSNMSDALSVGVGMSPPLSPMGLGEQYAAYQRNLGLQQSPITPGFPTDQLPQGWTLPVSQRTNQHLITDSSSLPLLAIRPTLHPSSR